MAACIGVAEYETLGVTALAGLCAASHRRQHANVLVSAVAKNTPQTRTLHRALECCGGITELARALGVSVGELSHWLEGLAPPPAEIYLSALDIVGGLSKGDPPPRSRDESD